MKLILGSICLVGCLSGLVRGQPAHDKGPELRSPNPPQVSYVIRAELMPESALVRGEMEIEYHNRTKDTLSELLLATPHAMNRDPRGMIDSVLLNGTPVESLRHDTSMITHIPLPGPLLPRQSVHLLLSYTCSVSKLEFGRSRQGLLGLVDWYPRIQPRGRENLRGQLCSGEAADFAVSLTVDSNWIAAGTGELLNEKELLGFLPRGEDTIDVDALAHPEAQGKITLGKIPSQSGRRTWIWREANSPRFSVAVSKSWKLDRIIADSCIVDVYYDQNDRGSNHGKLNTRIQSLVRALGSLTGMHPFTQTPLVEGVRIEAESEAETPIFLSSNVLGDDLREASVAIKLARLWARPVLSDPEDGPDDPMGPGVANYLAAEALHRVDSVHGYDNYFRFADRMIGYRNGVNPLSMSRPMGWMNQVRVPDRPTHEDTVRFAEFFQIPAKLHLLHRYLGDTVFFKGLHLALAPNSAGYPIAFHWRDAFQASSKDLDWFFGRGWDLSSTDGSLTDVHARSCDSGVVVTGTCLRGMGAPIDLTLGFVLSSTDTAFQPLRLPATGWPMRQAFSVLLPKLPRAVILDPHYDHPDAHRDNNYFFFERGAGFHEDQSQVFPGYRRLKFSR